MNLKSTAKINLFKCCHLEAKQSTSNVTSFSMWFTHFSWFVKRHSLFYSQSHLLGTEHRVQVPLSNTYSVAGQFTKMSNNNNNNNKKNSGMFLFYKPYFVHSFFFFCKFLSSEYQDTYLSPWKLWMTYDSFLSRSSIF